MTRRAEQERELADAKRERTVTVLHGLTPVSFYLPHRTIGLGTYYRRSSLISLFTPVADAYAGSKVDEFRKNTAYKEKPGAAFDMADVLARHRRGEPQAYDLSAVLGRTAQSLKEIRLCSDLKLNFFIHDFGSGHTSVRSVTPHISPVFNKAVVQSWAAPSAERFVSGFRALAQKTYMGVDDIKLGHEVYVSGDAMQFQIKRGLKILAHINHALRHDDNVSADDQKFWGYIQNAIAPR